MIFTNAFFIAQERKRLEEERKTYIYHKGRKMKANKQDVINFIRFNMNSE